MTNLVNGQNTLKPGIPTVELSPTPRMFEEFARFEPSEQAEIISVLQHMHSNRGGFNDAIAAVRGREGGNTVAPKSWARL